MWKLLVIDDESDRAELVVDWFEPIGFDVVCAFSGRSGLEKARDLRPDLILLDIVMPEMEGHEVLLRLKRDPSTASIPVIIYSFKADQLDGLQDLMLRGLREGADYVVARKWGMQALEKVVEKFLPSSEKPPGILIGEHRLKLGKGCKEVWVNDVYKPLTSLEANLLAHLDSHRGQPCGVGEMQSSIWGDELPGGDETRVRRVIERLRDKIEPDPSNPIFIVTVRGYGYKLVGEHQ